MGAGKRRFWDGLSKEFRSQCAVVVFGCAALACLCFLLLQAPSAFAQVDQGSITGIVKDQTGAVVPNAKVTLLNTDQGLTLETTTERLRRIHVLAGQNRALHRYRYGSRIRHNHTAEH